MSKAFDVTQGHVSLTAEFTEPRLRLFAEPTAFYQEVLHQLGPHGLRLVDMKVEWGEGSLADYHLRCFFLNYGVTLRFRAERIEMWFDLSRVTEAQAITITGGTFEAIKNVLNDPSFRSFTTDIALHGVVAETSPKDFLLTFVKEAPNFGPSIGSGAVFYYGPEHDRLSLSVTVDLSGLVKDGLYVRHNAVWDGTKIGRAELLAAVQTHLDQSLEALGLSRQAAG